MNQKDNIFSNNIFSNDNNTVYDINIEQSARNGHETRRQLFDQSDHSNLQKIQQKSSDFDIEFPTFNQDKIGQQLQKLKSSPSKRIIQIRQKNLSQFQSQNSKLDKILRLTESAKIKQNANNEWSFLNKMGKVKLFIEKLKQFSKRYNYNKLNQYHYKLIDDQAFSNEIIKKDYIYLLTSKVHKLINKIPVFLPNELFGLIWIFIMLMNLLICVLLIPFQVCFGDDLYENATFKFFLIDLPRVIIVLDLILILNFGYFKEGVIVTDRKMIFKRFIEKKILRGLLTIMPLLVLNPSHWFNFIILIRFQEIKSLIGKIDDYFWIQRNYYAAYELCKLIGGMIYLGHIIACFFHLIAYTEEQNQEQNWIHKYNLFEENIYVKYVNSLYFSFITIVTVGYGDISPVTIKEKLYIIIVTISASCIYGYVVNTIGTIFQERSLKESSFRRKKYELLDYLENRNISKNLQIKVVKTLQFEHKMHIRGFKKYESILNDIQPTIKSEIQLEFFGKFLKECDLFNINFSQYFLQKVPSIMKEQTLMPGELLFKEGEMNQKIYFIYKGEIELFITMKGRNKIQEKIFQVKNEQNIANNTLGEAEFLYVQPKKYSARSQKISQLVYIDRQDFLNLLEHHSQDYEIFCKLRDQIIFNKKIQGLKCCSCKSYQHNVLKCPLITSQMNRYLILAKYRATQDQKRDIKFQRKLKKQFSPLFNKSIIKEDLKAFRINLIQEYNDQILDSQNYLDKLSDEQWFNNQEDSDFFQGLPYFMFDKCDGKLEVSNTFNEMDDILDDSNYQLDRAVSIDLDQNLNNNNNNSNIIEQAYNQNQNRMSNGKIVDAIQNQQYQRKTITSKKTFISSSSPNSNRKLTVLNSSGSLQNLFDINQLYMYQFDQVKEFKKYFSNYNFSIVIGYLKKYQADIVKKVNIEKKKRLISQALIQNVNKSIFSQDQQI